jgi:hypothetical protein
MSPWGWRFGGRRGRDDSPSVTPPELVAIEERLRAMVFEPRASLGPEVVGRIARGDEPKVWAPPPPQWPKLAVAGILILVGAAGLAAYAIRGLPGKFVTIDRCCWDLDGGGAPDDGVVITAAPGGVVVHLVVYEDRDGSRSFTPGDVTRLDRGANAAIGSAGLGAVVTGRICCFDLDGQGPADDGLLVLGHPPDQIVLAGLYEVSLTGRRAGMERPTDHLR